MRMRMVQRGFALGLLGVLGVIFIAGPASGAAVHAEAESSQPAEAEEGLGEHRNCPELLSKMFIKAWCSYSCKRGTETIGGAFIMKLRTGGESGPWCIDKDGKLL